VFDSGEGNDFCFVLLGGSKNQGFKKLGFHCSYQVNSCCLFFTSELKMYYNSSSMPFITSQPSSRQDVPASVLEANAIAVTIANEWENEWNQSGLASRLSKEVGTCVIPNQPPL